MKVRLIDVMGLNDSTMTFGKIYEVEYHSDDSSHHYWINGFPYYRTRFEIVEEETKMSNKEKLQQQLEQLQKTIDDAQKQAEKIHEELNKTEYKALFDLLDANQTYVLSSRNVYPNQEMANAYDKAFKTMIELRKCQGTEPANDNVQYFIVPRLDTNILVAVSSKHLSGKCSEISPMFDTEDNLNAAIESVGKENILDMFKTFHGVK